MRICCRGSEEAHLPWCRDARPGERTLEASMAAHPSALRPWPASTIENFLDQVRQP